MKKETLTICGSIPAIIWGKSSDKVYLHVHGKMSRKEYAEQFAGIAETNGFQTLSFDLPEHGDRNDGIRCDIFNEMNELRDIYAFVSERWSNISLFACSLGAHFSLNTFTGKEFSRCLFQSPIVDMPLLVKKMLLWQNTDEKTLKEKGEIPSPIDPIRWDSYSYTLSHPITEWNVPTKILYGAKDNMQSRKAIDLFYEKFGCTLTVSPESEHPFMAENDREIVARWIAESIK